MRLAPSNCRIRAGLCLAISLVAIGPPVASAQNASVRSLPPGYLAAQVPVEGSRGENGGPPQRESLFGGQGIRWPKMPFARSKAPQQSQATAQRTQMGGRVPNAPLKNPRYANGQPNRMPSQGRAANTQPRMPMQRQNMAASQSPRTAQSANNYANMPTQRVATRPSPSPRQVPVIVPSSEPAAPAARPSAPESPAVQMLAQAHEWSTSAQSENDFTRIVDTCRQVQAANHSEETAAYADDLAAWALNRRGQLKAEAGQNDAAIEDFTAAIDADAKLWRAYHNRAVLRAQEGDFEHAFDDFTRTLQINPKFAKAYANRAALFVVAGHVEPAIQDYQKAIELDPDSEIAYRGLGRACHLSGDLETALRNYDEAVRLSPNDAYAIASRADVLTDLGRYSEAAEQYNRAIEADPNSSQACSGSAWLLATCPDDSIRDSKLAIERAETAVQLTNGEDAATLDTLAAALANDGDFDAAKQTVEQAVELSTESERQAFEARLSLYEQQRPYRLAPLDEVVQISHEE